MVFVSNPTPQSLTIRQMPLRAMAVALAFAGVLFAAAYGASDTLSTSILFTAGVIVLWIAAWISHFRKLTFNADSLEIRDIRALKRQTTRHALQPEAYAEVLIVGPEEGDDNDSFQPWLVNGEDRIDLGTSVPMEKSAAKVVLAINLWRGETVDTNAKAP